MNDRIKINTLLACGLATVFWVVFQFTKQDPVLAKVIPFGDDPYDSVGSYATMALAGLAGISLVRTFRLRAVTSSRFALRQMYLIRTQIAMPLVVIVVLLNDAVAMVRHPSMWMHADSRSLLLSLLAGVACLALAVLRLVYMSQAQRPFTRHALQIRAAVFLLLAIGILLVYPERLIQPIIPHLATVLVGALILFAPVGQLTTALVTGEWEGSVPIDNDIAQVHVYQRYAWPLATLAGFAFGALAYLGEATEGGNRGFTVMPLARVFMVAAVFIGLGTCGMVIAFYWLRKPLGLGV